MKPIIEEAKKFLISYLEDRVYKDENFHPWRKDTKYIILHSYRVYSYALKIIKNEGKHLTEQDKLAIQIASILHDIGKTETLSGEHGEISVQIVRNWMNNNKELFSEIKDKEKILKIISRHSYKDYHEDDLCCSILKDADIMDEIGIMSIYMTSYRISESNPFFFNELFERINFFELDYSKKQYQKLNTEYAKKMFRKKIDFIEMFCAQLSLEIEGTDDFYKSYKEDETNYNW